MLLVSQLKQLKRTVSVSRCHCWRGRAIAAACDCKLSQYREQLMFNCHAFIIETLTVVELRQIIMAKAIRHDEIQAKIWPRVVSWGYKLAKWYSWARFSQLSFRNLQVFGRFSQTLRSEEDCNLLEYKLYNTTVAVVGVACARERLASVAGSDAATQEWFPCWPSGQLARATASCWASD